MAVGTLISVDEYLQTSYRPDRDYVDGVLIERNMGERSHGRLATRIGVWLYAHEAKWNAEALTETRLQINSSRFRIPNLMVLSREAPREEIVRTPPLLCIEILSKGDTLESIWDRIDDYFSIGVPVCWVIDPVRGRGWTAAPRVLTEVPDGILRAGQIEMPLDAVLEPR